MHAIGGIVGGLCTGFLADPQICTYAGMTIPNQAGVSTFTSTTPVCTNGLVTGNVQNGLTQLKAQCVAIAFCIAWAGFGTFILLFLVDKLFGGLRVSVEDEEKGLDQSIHGESIEDEEENPKKNILGADESILQYEGNPAHAAVGLS